MTTKELSGYLLNEEAAEKWLRDKKILTTYEFCPLCGSGHLGRIRRERYRCYECKNEWNIRKGSWLESMHLECSTIIGIMKMFCDEVNAAKCAYELEVSRRTVLRLYEDFRKTLVGLSETLTDENEIVVLIASMGGKVSVNLCNVSDETTKQSKLTLRRQKQTDGQYYYSILYSSISTKKILRAINKINDLDEFYRYCQERVLKFRGRDIAGLNATLQELAYRVNHRHDKLFDLLVNSLVASEIAAGTGGALIPISAQA